MKKTLLALSMVLSTTTATVHADNTQSLENGPSAHKSLWVGAGSGAVFGAAVAGPVGFAVGGLMGMFLGSNHYHKETLALTETALKEEKQALWAANQSLSQYQDALNEANLALRQAKLTELMTQVQFKTGSADIAAIFYPQLQKLVSIMNQDADLHLHIQGYADQRGDEEYNWALSQQRAQKIKDYLQWEGIAENRMTVTALGETESAAQNFEDQFFDRKVVMHLTTDKKAMTVKR